MRRFDTVPAEGLGQRLATAPRARLVDVREYDEFERVHVDGAECAPMSSLLTRASAWPTDETLFLICHSGQRAREAAESLGGVGFEHVTVVDGGTSACLEAGVPVVRGRKRIPIQRQVVIGSALIVLAGLVMGLYHPAWRLVSWVTAGSMVVSGVSGFCPMAKLLAAAPWNCGGACDVEASARTTQGGCSCVAES